MTDATMPPLPRPAKTEPSFVPMQDIYMPQNDVAYFTADQMRAYAAQCLAAVAEDAERYSWAKEHEFFMAELAATTGSSFWDAAIDNARGKKQ